MKTASTYKDAVPDKSEINRYFNRINNRSDKLLTFLLICYFFVGLILAGKYDTWLVALLAGGLSVISYLVIKLIFPDKGWHRYVGSFALGVMSVLGIYQLHGSYPMHFTVFLSAVTLIAYQNYRLQIPVILVVVSHYVLFAFLEAQGMEGVRSVAGQEISLETFFLHIIISGAILGACLYWSIVLRKHSIRLLQHAQVNKAKRQALEKGIAFAQEIAVGDLEAQYETEKHDALGKALLKIQQNLIVAREKENREKFVNAAIAEISRILRDLDDDLTTVSNKLIAKLVTYFGANQGGLFLTETVPDREPVLKLMAFYAWDRHKYAQQIIRKGEGLIGQAFLEKDTIYLTKIPDGYIRITSGLGDALPDALLIVPLMVRDEVYGVVEMAAFGGFEPFKIKFLKKLGETIASAISNHTTAAYTRKLLDDSRELTEQLRNQEEEMRQNMEELQATQEELIRNEKAMQKRLTNVKTDPK